MPENREIRPWWWAMIMVLMVVFLGVAKNEAAAPSAADCKLERKLRMDACKLILDGLPPSPECCYHIRVTHTECVCPFVTPQLAALIGDLNRAFRIIQSCGRSLPRHYKCGSITFP